MTTPLVTRVLLADDHPIVLHGLRDLLDREPDFQVVCEAKDGAEAVRMAVSGDVDLAVLDVSMPRMTGLQAAQEITARRPEVRVLMLSMHDNEQFFYEALRAGENALLEVGEIDARILGNAVVDARVSACRGRCVCAGCSVAGRCGILGHCGGSSVPGRARHGDDHRALCAATAVPPRLHRPVGTGRATRAGCDGPTRSVLLGLPADGGSTVLPKAPR